MSAAADSPPEVDVRRSRRRRRTVSAYREGDRIVVLIPASMSKRDEATWVVDMVARIQRQEGRKRRSDDDLVVRARKLNDLYLGGLAVPASVRWVTNQNSRWGSCTPGDRSIRLSARLQHVPAWVVDYVLVHELAHLLEAGHTPEFWAWVERYPRAEKAKGYLEGYSAAARLEPPPGGDGNP
ncbi:MAG: M48 family metallopeptidase [Nocardioides sp.]|nr:M48 family metallopeptidase [Nocardioides sp.]